MEVEGSGGERVAHGTPINDMQRAETGTLEDAAVLAMAVHHSC